MRLALRALLALALSCLGLAAIAQGTAPCLLTTRAEEIAGGAIVYNTAGSGPTILLIHGLFANKEQWNALACRLVDSGYTVIAVDLPGYGKSKGFAIADYALDAQVQKLRALAGRLRIQRMDVAGNSMGGAIAGLYASRYPEQVRSLAFIGSPLGVVGWNRGIRDAMLRGINPFIPISEPQLDLELRLLFVTPPMLPEPEGKSIVADYVTNNLHYVQVWNIVSLYHEVLMRRRPPRIPTLIVWGEQDQVFDVAGAPRLRDRIPGSEVQLLPRAGHLLHMENAAEVAPIYTRFLATAVQQPSPPVTANPIVASFACDSGKTLEAAFDNRAPGSVRLVLSDGRDLALPQTRSASGARYADRGEGFVFWNKGDTAFIEEDGKVTYSGCKVRR